MKFLNWPYVEGTSAWGNPALKIRYASQKSQLRLRVLIETYL
jgi:hypothetical protein